MDRIVLLQMIIVPVGMDSCVYFYGSGTGRGVMDYLSF